MLTVRTAFKNMKKGPANGEGLLLMNDRPFIGMPLSNIHIFLEADTRWTKGTTYKAVLMVRKIQM